MEMGDGIGMDIRVIEATKISGRDIFGTFFIFVSFVRVNTPPCALILALYCCVFIYLLARCRVPP